MSAVLSQDSSNESSVVTPVVSFSSLGLRPELLNALKEKGYEIPTPVQAAVIPIILKRRDVLAGAQTGTGKTAGFTLPLLQLLMQPSEPGRKEQVVRRPNPRRYGPSRPVRALILTPTRELAAQVEESVHIYGKFLPLTSTAVFGGVNMNPQIRSLGRGVDILVATPGRLMDHVSQHTVDLGQVEILVLDEADRMLDMGFIRDIRKILALLPEQRQNLLFSATFSEEIKTLANELLDSPQHVEIGAQNTESALVTQTIYMTNREHKRDLLVELLVKKNISQALVFTRTKHGADRLAGQLEQDGVSTAAIHSNRSQQQRTRALADFKAGAVRILVATDIAARGLDIAQLPHVINFDLPNVPEDYVHRIGRTGRAGSLGEAISLVSHDEQKFLQAIERLLKKKLERRNVDGSVASASVAMPSAPAMSSPRMSSQREEMGGNRPAFPRSRGKQQVEVQWGDAPRSHKGISAIPRHKRKPSHSGPAAPAPFERFMPRKEQPSRNR